METFDDQNSGEDCVPYRYNTELVEYIRPGLKYAAMTLLIASIILDMIAYKWRWCADWILYFESINTFITMLIPSVEGIRTEMYINSVIVLAFISFYTDTRAQIAYLTLVHFVDAFVIKSLVETKSLTLQSIVLKISQIIGVFALNTLFAALIQYITTLHDRLKTMNFENIRLLDGMHEGLLILTKTKSTHMKNELMFCNNSA